MASASLLNNSNCCLKTCKNKGLKPSDNKVHVRAPYQNKESGLEAREDEMLAVWDGNGEAKFHMKCWKIIREAAARKTNNNNMANGNHVTNNNNHVTVGNQVTSNIHVTELEKLLVAEASMTVEFYNSDVMLKREAKRIASMLKKCKYSVVFTGAGISTPTGVEDYRGINGKWTNQDRNNGCQASAATAKRRGPRLEDIRPTYTHEALTKLLDMGQVKHVISQNTDGLHRLSGIPKERLSELHGNCFIEKCEVCDTRCELRHGYHKGATDASVPSSVCEMCKCNHRTGRRCAEKDCSGYMRSTVINFGDRLEEEVLSGAVNQAETATFVLVLGSSLYVSPANSLIQMGKEPLRLAICNRQVTDFDVKCFELDSSGNQLGSRVFSDCDALIREVMKCLMGPDDHELWEDGRADRMKNYDSQRIQSGRQRNV
ncbi:NAD-dependent protein deacetylase SRT1-like [Mizuhopecten yessoensis]|uniref:Regulatory protein SIR2 homolog 7 n=1 Tax=Mizuhopecten yessoensis TaxID=6573 RepID=A0A210QM18_MIZYE|nr:NAD-dependent protein deacetylase SRT1-like [Mizuhopecten yessoensis]OWF49786.1 NAD-dependent protein deacetylase SRT1 [Mizuhopecten yessoensis]